MIERSEANIDPLWRWHEGQVDQSQPHLKIRYVSDIEDPKTSYLVAFVSAPHDHVFTVEFLPQNLPATMDPGPIIDGAKGELNYVLIELREEDPWKYARYHCTTASNLYSHFQWAVSHP
ncbi:MAG: hypothetical protein Q8L77_14525 [Nitrospirota bacterium]|nr:hypothetical protein [Nitrospirota bacterium]